MRAAAIPSLVLLLSACGGGGGGGGGGPAARPPLQVVASVDPPHRATTVPLDATVKVTFLTAMDEAPLLGGALVLAFNGTTSPVDADIEVSLSRTSVTIRPLSPLAGDRDYQVRLSALARRADGREIGRPWFSNFRTGPAGPPPPPPPPPQGGTVAAAGSLLTGRSGHAAVALDDGRVAVFGGYDTSATVTASIEVYDPAGDRWTAAGYLATARGHCSATLLEDGRVLVAGGETASATDVGLGTFEIWDPDDGSVAPPGALAERRTRHRAVRLSDGRVLLVGGSRTDGSGQPNFSRASAEVFDPSTGVCSAITSMSVARAGHGATLLPDGRVLVTGGHGSDPAAEVFDPGTGTFAAAGTMSQARRDHTATLLADGSVLVAGGGSASSDRWIPAQNSFLPMQNLGDARSLAAAVRIGNGRVMVCGGERPIPGGGTFFHVTVDFFDPATGAFLFPDVRLRAARTGHTATLLPGGDVLIAGGKNGLVGLPALGSCDRVRF